MRVLDRWFTDKRGISVRVIRWEPESSRVIYLRTGYEHGECFCPLIQFKRHFREIEAPDELTSESETAGG
ncbi:MULTISPECIES: DUF4222 domain-containing protein [Pantoea]|uniref:DUF4222 domain-containing protein n=1 Tax=Pantoea TaxID=53335 RepID=UPI0009006B36|nr:MULTISPECIES: DUF4222 domain-containing protein [Pantoea]